MQTVIETKSLLIGTIFWAMFFLVVGMYAGTLMVKQTVTIVPTKYSTRQIDNLIAADAILANASAILGSQVKRDLDYEQSFSQKQ